MFGRIKKNGTAVAIFIINSLLLFLAICYIRNEDEARKNQIKTDNSIDLKPIGQELIAKQGQIVADREQKLRDLNTVPKTVEQKSITTTKEETTTTPSAPATDRTTKTS